MIHADLQEHIGYITLRKPDKHNALDRDMLANLTDTLAEWEKTDIRVVIITGEGKSFCSGASLGNVASEDWTSNPLTDFCNVVDAFAVPIICAMNGGVYGGGVELALACDFRIGVNGMKMFVPPAKLGIHYEPAGIARAIDRLGSQTTRRAFLLGETFDDEALLACGFLDKLVEANELENQAIDMAKIISSMAPMAIRGMKQTIREIATNSLDKEAAAKRIADCFASDDHREGLAARNERRAPVFKGH